MQRVIGTGNDLWNLGHGNLSGTDITRLMLK